MGVNDITEAGVAHYLALAEATPRRLAAAAAGLDETRLHQPPAPEAWSALDILNHLRGCEEVWMHSLHAMLAHDQPHLQEIHPRQWIESDNPYKAQSFADGLRIFSLRREALIITLRRLSLVHWGRGAAIDRKTHTVFSHVRRMTLHEDTHCGEIEMMLKGI